MGDTEEVGFRPKGLLHTALVLVQLTTGHTEPVAVLPESEVKDFIRQLAVVLNRAGVSSYQLSVRPIPLYFRPGMNPIAVAHQGN